MLCVLNAILLAGCPGTSEIEPESIVVDTVRVTGRVVDFETCFSSAGCQSVPNLVVSLYYNGMIRSAPTGADGAYELSWVPDSIKSHLVVSEEASDDGHSYLTTLQANTLTTNGTDIFGLELFAVPRRGGLYEGIVNELSTPIEQSGLFIGQVYLTNESSAMVTFAGARVASTPSTTIRFIKSNPRYPEQWGDTTTLHPEGQEVTTAIGSFLAVGSPNTGEVTFSVTSPNATFPPIASPLLPGLISLGLIEGRPGGQSPPADGGGGGS